jgi:hypothetical protein
MDLIAVPVRKGRDQSTRATNRLPSVRARHFPSPIFLCAVIVLDTNPKISRFGRVHQHWTQFWVGRRASPDRHVTSAGLRVQANLQSTFGVFIASAAMDQNIGAIRDLTDLQHATTYIGKSLPVAFMKTAIGA